MELLAIWGEFLGGIGVIISLVFLGMQTRTSNRLALAASQREQRHIWQDMMFYMGEHSSEYREFIHNYEDMAPDSKGQGRYGFFCNGQSA